MRSKKTSKQEDYLQDEPRKQPSKAVCMVCGSARGKLHKIKNKGRNGFLCEFCFDEYKGDF